MEIIPFLISVGREDVHWEHLEQELLRGGESDSQRQPTWPHLRDGLSHLRSPMIVGWLVGIFDVENLAESFNCCDGCPNDLIVLL